MRRECRSWGYRAEAFLGKDKVLFNGLCLFGKEMRKVFTIQCLIIFFMDKNRFVSHLLMDYFEELLGPVLGFVKLVSKDGGLGG